MYLPSIFWLSVNKRFCKSQFQDSLNLWELNENKREVNGLKKYYMDIMVVVCEIKKVTACENTFWERDIHYGIKNNGIHTYFNKMKIFYLNYRVMNVNLVLSILFLVIIQICFRLNFHNTQLCMVSFCFGYYLRKKRPPPQVYVEIKGCIFRLKNGCNSKPNVKHRNFKRFSLGEKI